MISGPTSNSYLGDHLTVIGSYWMHTSGRTTRECSHHSRQLADPERCLRSRTNDSRVGNEYVGEVPIFRRAATIGL